MKRPINYFIIFSFTGIISLTALYILMWGRMITTPSERNGSDFMGLYSGARIFQEQGFPYIYDPELQINIQRQVVGFEFPIDQTFYYMHPPFVILLVTLITNESYVLSLAGWSLIIIILNFLSTLLLIKSAKHLNLTSLQKWILAGGTFLFWPSFSGLMNGQDTGLLILGACIWFYYLIQGESLLSGVGLGLTVIRPQSAIMFIAPFFIRNRRFLWGAMISGGLLAVVSLALIGRDGFSSYIDIIHFSEGDLWRLPHSLDMPSISGIIRRNMDTVGQNAFRSIIWPVYIAGITLIVTWLGRKQGFETKDAGLLVLCVLCFVPYNHYHELTLLLIPIFALIHILSKNNLVSTNLLTILPLSISIFLIMGFFGEAKLKYIIVYIVMFSLAYGLTFPHKFFNRQTLANSVKKKMNKAHNNSKDSLTTLLDSLALILIFFLFSRTPVDADVWWHLRAGQIMWEKKIILLNDLFSYTKFGSPWVNAFWAPEVLLFLIHKAGGYFSIALFVSIMGIVTFYFTQLQLKGIPTFIKSFIILLAATTAAPIWGPRPQLFSFLFVAILDWWLNIHHKPYWLLPILFSIWANLHGGWIWGFLLLMAHLAGLFGNYLFLESNQRDDLKGKIFQLFCWSSISILAIGLNPNGLSIWSLPFQQVNVSLQIQEWLSPDFHRIDFHPMLWMLFLLFLAAPFSKKPVNWPQVFKVLGFAYLTFFSQRNIAPFSIVAAPLLAEWFSAFLELFHWKKLNIPQRSLKPPLTTFINFSLLFIVSLGSLGYLYSITRPSRVDLNYPVEALAWIKNEHPEGHMFNSYNWGGYLIWQLPEHPVFIDGRADLYGNELVNKWHQIYQGTDHGIQLLDEYQIQWVMVESSAPLLKALPTEQWEKQYLDDKAAIYQRMP